MSTRARSSAVAAEHQDGSREAKQLCSVMHGPEPCVRACGCVVCVVAGQEKLSQYIFVYVVCVQFCRVARSSVRGGVQ